MAETERYKIIAVFTKNECKHTYTAEEVISKATTKKDGRVVTKCKTCGKILSEDVIKRAY